MTKLEAYKAGLYRIPAPPVYTGNWDGESWIAFIDLDGMWTVPVEE